MVFIYLKFVTPEKNYGLLLMSPPAVSLTFFYAGCGVEQSPAVSPVSTSPARWRSSLCAKQPRQSHLTSSWCLSPGSLFPVFNKIQRKLESSRAEQNSRLYPAVIPHLAFLGPLSHINYHDLFLRGWRRTVLLWLACSGPTFFICFGANHSSELRKTHCRNFPNEPLIISWLTPTGAQVS